MGKVKKRARKISRKKIKARKLKRKKAPSKPRTSKVVMKKCIKCKAPLSGFMHKYIGRPIFGIKPSTKKKGYCNKCE
ncbi:hypothetical protein JW851_01770 [Candidatus Woesearchaeota archaeon]|nr:hypothetical protein [Candidatus Woesearchaeota archaeon]